MDLLTVSRPVVFLLMLLRASLGELLQNLPYSGKFSRKKIFTNFAIFKLQPPAIVFSTKFWACHTHYAISLTFRESFLYEMFPSYQSAKVFSFKSFLLHGIARMNYLSNITTMHACMISIILFA